MEYAESISNSPQSEPSYAIIPPETILGIEAGLKTAGPPKTLW
jgi:hypothetical protein